MLIFKKILHVCVSLVALVALVASVAFVARVAPVVLHLRMEDFFIESQHCDPLRMNICLPSTNCFGFHWWYGPVVRAVMLGLATARHCASAFFGTSNMFE